MRDAQHGLSTRASCPIEVRGPLRSLCICCGNEEQNSVSGVRSRCQPKNPKLDCQETEQDFGRSDDGRGTEFASF
jgi:hypothetical protein